MANKLHYDITAKDRTKRVFNALGSSLKKVGKAVFNMKTALVGLAGIAGLGLLVRASLKSIDNLGKLSRQIFISTEDLGAFRLASELGGTSLEAFAKGARTLAVGINDYLVKGTGVAKEAFEQLGITADDLKSTNGDLFSQFELVADALSQLKDGTDKTAIAYKLFGGRNIELLTAIEGGAGGLRKIREEAERFGLTLSAEMVAKVEAVNDSITKMKMRFKGLIDQITVRLAPAFLILSEKIGATFDKFISKQGGLDKFADTMGSTLLTGVQKLLRAFGKFAVLMDRIFTRVVDFIKWTGLLDGEQEKLLATMGKLRKEQDTWIELQRQGFITYEKMTEELNRINFEMLALQALLENATSPFEEFNMEGLSLILWLEKADEGLTALINDIQKAEESTVSYAGSLAHLRELQNKYIDNDKMIESINKETQAEKDLLEQKKASSKGAIALYKTELEERLAFNKQIKQNTFDTLQALSGINRTAFRAFKAMQIAETTINAIKAASKAFAQFSFPMNYIMAGTHYAKGMALVAQIRSTSYSGKRMGGDVREGQPYMVGEAGRELFVPNQSGNIVANDQLGRNVNVNFHIETVDAGGFDQLLSQRRSLIVNMINSAVNEQGKQAIV